MATRVLSIPRWGRDGAATAALGPEHPLVRAIELERVLVRDVLAVAAVGTLVLVAIASGMVEALWPAAAVVLPMFAFAICAAAARAAVRRRAWDLIAEGRECLPVPVIARERERLLAAAHRRMLARSFARYRMAAQAPPWPRGSATAVRGRTVRDVDAELRALERLLEECESEARGVVQAERLIVDAGSPLHGGDPQRLREELRRITMLLAASPSRS